MPYVDQATRDALADNAYYSTSVGGDGPITAGELNYCITRLCDRYLSESKHKYTDYNEIIGVLECAKLEFYRRLIVPYEDQKKEENGDVYDNA